MKEIDDVKAAASQGLSASVAQLVEKIATGIFEGAKGYAANAKVSAKTGFETYLSSTKSRIGAVKTLISRVEPVQLIQAYEPVYLKIDNNLISIDNFLQSVDLNYKYSIITGSLGAGKSFTMRYLFLSLLEEKSIKRIPIFVELRNLKDSNGTLIGMILDQLKPFVSFIDENSVIAGLKTGAFVILLDGFDEVNSAERDDVGKQIINLSELYPNSRLILSSRPDHERFLSWPSFFEFQVEPLSLDQVVGLIERVKYDDAEKAVFVRRIKSDLYDSHQTLMSNPLLASMMLMTYNEFQEIPSKMYIFYAAAFDVLYRKHDAMKTDFKREFYSGLEHHSFRQLFMTLSFMSYMDRVFVFEGDQLDAYVESASKYENISVIDDGYKRDLVENLCILIKEGDRTAYLHRSFQEYFTAIFFSRRSIDDISNFVDIALRNGKSDDEAVNMFIDMDQEEFERKYFINKLEDFYIKILNENTTSGRLGIISKFFVGPISF